MAIDPSRVKRYAHGSRVPGWDEAADLTKDPAVVPDPATTPVPAEVRAAIEAHMAKYPDIRSAAIPALQVVQDRYGWCSPSAIEQAACVMRLTPAYLTAVATFYDMFETGPRGAHRLRVHQHLVLAARRRQIYDEMLSAAGDDPRFNVRAFECLGACDIAPMASVERRVRRAARDRGLPHDRRRLPGRQAGARVKAAAVPQGGGNATEAHDSCLYENIDEPGPQHARGLRAPRRLPDAAQGARHDAGGDHSHELLASNVRGRGGAGFQMGKKASFMPKGTMDKYLVCNADESEPGTFKDRELMSKNPHMLIEGMIIAAFAVGANKSFIFIRGEYQHPADILDAAVAEARAAGYLGERILGSEHTLDLVVHRGAGAYICGEETALLDSLEGKRGNPRLKPPFPANQGLYQGPTLINNVETLMNVPIVISMGGEEYARIGTATSTGTKVVSISGCVQRPGNYEVVLGTSSRELIFGLAGGPPEGRVGEGVVPRRLERAGAARQRRVPRPPVRVRRDGQGRLDARLRRDHRRSTTRSRSSTWR